MWFVLEEKGHFRYNITSMKVKKSVCVYHFEKVMNWVGEKMVFLKWGFGKIGFCWIGKLGYDDGVFVVVVRMKMKMSGSV
jgi:hypothetical protein